MAAMSERRHQNHTSNIFELLLKIFSFFLGLEYTSLAEGLWYYIHYIIPFHKTHFSVFGAL